MAGCSFEHILICGRRSRFHISKMCKLKMFLNWANKMRQIKIKYNIVPIIKYLSHFEIICNFIILSYLLQLFGRILNVQHLFNCIQFHLISFHLTLCTIIIVHNLFYGEFFSFIYSRTHSTQYRIHNVQIPNSFWCLKINWQHWTSTI